MFALAGFTVSFHSDACPGDGDLGQNWPTPEDLVKRHVLGPVVVPEHPAF